MERRKHSMVLFYFLSLCFNLFSYVKAVPVEPEKIIRGYEYTYKDGRHEVRPLYGATVMLPITENDKLVYDPRTPQYASNGHAILLPPTGHSTEFNKILNDYYNLKTTPNSAYEDVPHDLSTLLEFAKDWTAESSEGYNRDGYDYYEGPVVSSKRKRIYKDKVYEDTHCTNCNVETSKYKLYRDRFNPTVEYMEDTKHASNTELSSTPENEVKPVYDPSSVVTENHDALIHAETTEFSYRPVKVAHKKKPVRKGSSANAYYPYLSQENENIRPVVVKRKKKPQSKYSTNRSHDVQFSSVTKSNVNYETKPATTEADTGTDFIDKNPDHGIEHLPTAEGEFSRRTVEVAENNDGTGSSINVDQYHPRLSYEIENIGPVVVRRNKKTRQLSYSGYDNVQFRSVTEGKVNRENQPVITEADTISEFTDDSYSTDNIPTSEKGYKISKIQNINSSNGKYESSDYTTPIVNTEVEVQKQTTRCTKVQSETNNQEQDCLENEDSYEVTKMLETNERPVIVKPRKRPPVITIEKYGNEVKVLYNGKEVTDKEENSSSDAQSTSEEENPIEVIENNPNLYDSSTNKLPKSESIEDINVEDSTNLNEQLNIIRNLEVSESEVENEGSGRAADANTRPVPEIIDDERVGRLSLLNSNLFSLIFNPNAKNHNLKKCITRNNESGHCMYVQNCPVPNIAATFEQLLINSCVVDQVFIGVCCPEFPVETIQVHWGQTEIDSSNKVDDLDHKSEDCGTRSSEASKMLSWPWKAPLLSVSNGKIFCGGVIISEEYILTAAHCTTKIAKNQILVRLGQHDETSGEDFAVIEIKRHAQYNPRTLQNDIALLKLGRHAPFGMHVNRVCLPEDSETYADKKAILIGWKGVFGENPKPSEVLEVLSNEECKEKLNSNVPQSLLCTETRDEEETTCNADSGAPLVIEEDDQYKAIGILSWNRNDCDPKFPSTFSRISSYLGWIRKHAV